MLGREKTRLSFGAWIDWQSDGGGGARRCFICAIRAYGSRGRSKIPELRGDVDLIAWDDEWLCFVEVKTRSSRDLVPAEVAIDDEKQTMLRRMARAYLRGFPESKSREVPVRFDVVSFVLRTGGR